MGKLDGELSIERTEYGSLRVVTSTGDIYTLTDAHGALLVRVTHGGILLKPEASNSIEIQGRLARRSDW